MNGEFGLYSVDGSFISRTDLIKREEITLFQRSTDILIAAQQLQESYEIGVKEAVWTPEVEHPDRPLVMLMATDIHYGAIGTDYERLVEHLKIVENTPNITMVTNGDHVDNFNVTGKWATGVYENPLPPQIQTAAFIERLKELDQKHKLGVMSFGNHDNFGGVTGYDWFNTWCRDLNAPIFTSGGLLHIMYGKNDYKLALTHKYWGNSKLNPTNMTKRFWEHEYPEADILFIGHTHQSEVLHWERGGKDRISVVGGTYKAEDNWARKNGIGGRSGAPGIAVILWPGERRMEAVKDISILPNMMK